MIWRRVVSFGRLSRFIFFFVLACIFSRIFELNFLSIKMFQTKRHWSRSSYPGIERNLIISDEERNRTFNNDTGIQVDGATATSNLIQKSSSDKTIHSSGDFPYRYLINEENVCKKGIFIINVVPIAPSSVYSRNMIRELWANQKYWKNSLMQTMFLVGLPSTNELQHIIEKESTEYHDIIQVGLIDSYKNLTLKTLTILHWTEHFCPSATWILKSDEDVFVNSFALKNFLGQIIMRDLPRNVFVCKVNKERKVCRSKRKCPAKWIIPETLYAEKYYPTYCNGPAYIISRPLARQIYYVANKTNPFPMEDVYYTGIQAEGLNPHYVNLARSNFRSKYHRSTSYNWSKMPLFIVHVEKIKGRSSELWQRILQQYKSNILE
ncbi:beta-1,3-galactosyltransferase 1-like [Palaemon carinicauda]|uniref:beta-1,3-galactosyltransferase 1-like n=1 Tax=Palaemon carinicauda TaxID=392227 RepID=UPI0035B64520